MTAREFLNIIAILESMDEVPGMPDRNSPVLWRGRDQEEGTIWFREEAFRDDPIRFLFHADDATRAAIWAEAERRIKA